MSFVLCVLRTVIYFPFRRLDKEIYSEFSDSRKEKKGGQRDKTGNVNNVVFYAILVHPSHVQFLLKSQNTKVTNTEVTTFEHGTQNICIQNTMSHIGFRTILICEIGI